MARSPGSEQEQPLLGLTIGVTADRRREELVALLHRRGARVLDAPTVRIVPLDDDADLFAATTRCLTEPFDFVVATTGIGWRGWFSAADGWGLTDQLVKACENAVVVSRGPKATGALRAVGLREEYSPESEASEELLAWLLAHDLTGRRVVVQEHGMPQPAFTEALRAAGADVVTVPVYRWAPPAEPAAVHRLVQAAVRREVHAVAFTSAPAVGALLDIADQAGRHDALVDAFRRGVLAACIGPVCARPLGALGVTAIWPERGRMGALVRALAERLPPLVRREIPFDGRVVVVQGSAVLGADGPILLPPVPAAVLRELAERPGWVLSRADLLRRVWDGGADEHAVEAAVARLRSSLGPYADVVRTVTKRGYRLAVDP